MLLLDLAFITFFRDLLFNELNIDFLFTRFVIKLQSENITFIVVK